MAVGPIITLGYGPGGSPSLVLTLGYVSGEFEVPTSGSLEWTLPESRLHWGTKGDRLHYNRLPESRLHWNSKQ